MHMIGKYAADTLGIVAENLAAWKESIDDEKRPTELDEIEEARGPVTRLCAEGTNSQ